MKKIAVVGAGIYGCWIAYILSKKGYKIEIFEKNSEIISESSKLNQYRVHEVNVLKDYIEAFGENPPKNVSIAIMTDSDNTHEKSLSYIDYIEVKSE